MRQDLPRDHSPCRPDFTTPSALNGEADLHAPRPNHNQGQIDAPASLKMYGQTTRHVSVPTAVSRVNLSLLL